MLHPLNRGLLLFVRASLLSRGGLAPILSRHAKHPCRAQQAAPLQDLAPATRLVEESGSKPCLPAAGPALHRIAARLHLECGGLPPLSRAQQRQGRDPAISL
jgi:hypothetical protein